MREFPYKQNLRIRFANFFRRRITVPIVERLLITLLPQSSQIRRLIPPEYLYKKGSLREVTRDEIVYELDVSDVIGHSLYFFNRYFVPPKFFELLHPDFTVIDVGAHIGTSALPAAKKCFNGTVIAYEPASESFTSLNKNLMLNGFQNITIVKKGLGASYHKARLLRINSYNTGMNRIGIDNNLFPFEIIEITTLDEEVERLQLQRVDVIKIDVEGYEFEVLKGASKTIEKFHPLLIIEVVDSNLKANGKSGNDIIFFLRNAGYILMDLKTNQPLEDQINMETDLLCYTADKKNLLFR